MFHDPDYLNSPDFDDVFCVEEVNLDELVFESVVPAVCRHGCEVEPDGACPHGMPSLLIHLGVI